MRAPEYKCLRLTLLESGIAPRFVERTILELREHYVDIELDALNSGLSASAAAAHARATLGSEVAIVAAVRARPELLSFAHRWPACARRLRAIAFYALLPAVPIVYCAQRRSAIARWGVSIGVAFVLTGGLLFLLQQAIAS
jgi:hypothetical protein